MRKNIGLILGLALVLAGCNSGPKTPPGTIFVSGRIDGDPVDIAPKINGKLVEIMVREGDNVKAGQVLARIESPQDQARRDEAAARLQSSQDRIGQLQLQIPIYDERLRQAQLTENQASTDAPARVAQAEAQLASTKAELARATADLEQNRNDAGRYAALAQKGAVSNQLAEQYTTRVRTSEAAVEASRRQVSAAEANLAATKALLTTPRIRQAEHDTIQRQKNELLAQIKLAQADANATKASLARVEADLADLEIRAPVDGTIITRAAEPGRVVSAGTTILTMIDLSKLYLRAFVPEGQIGQVKIGQNAQVFLDSAPKEALSAEVMRIDPQAMFTPENTYFQQDRVKQVVGVKLKLKSGFGAAKPGMPADGHIQVSTQS